MVFIPLLLFCNKALQIEMDVNHCIPNAHQWSQIIKYKILIQNTEYTSQIKTDTNTDTKNTEKIQIQIEMIVNHSIPNLHQCSLIKSLQQVLLRYSPPLITGKPANWPFNPIQSHWDISYQTKPNPQIDHLTRSNLNGTFPWLVPNQQISHLTQSNFYRACQCGLFQKIDLKCKTRLDFLCWPKFCGYVPEINNAI